MSTALPVKQKRSVLGWPLRGAWWFVTKACNRTGILGGLVLGLLCMLLGYVLTVSIIAALLGIPLFLFGLLLTARALY
jgi:hypothetical protein